MVCLLSLALASTVLAQEISWLHQDKPSPLARQAVLQLNAADRDGLDPQRYGARELQQTYERLVLARRPDRVLAASFSERLTDAMVHYLTDLSRGRITPQTVGARFDGPPPRDFDAQGQLRLAVQANDLDSVVQRARPSFPLYGALQTALLQYQALEGHPAWQQPLPTPMTGLLEQGQPYAGLAMLSARLQALGDLQVSDTEADHYGPALEHAVRAFQRRHGLTVDGIVGPQTLAALEVSPAQRANQIAISMERLRWTPLQQNDRLIVVNVPGFMLYAYEIDEQAHVDLKLEMRVVVGRSVGHRTPLFDQEMLFIEFSPYWNIPYSIARRETIPALRRDPDYLYRQGLEFVDSSGQISTDMSEQALQSVLDGELRIRQRPGPQNALGTVKFIFPNHQNIFLHHTPSTHLFDCERRDLSAGCVRVEEPFELAKFVLAADEQWTDEMIWQAMQAGRSQTIRLQQPIPVVIGYSTVMVRDGTVYFYPDIYGHDVTLMEALANERKPR